MKVNVIHLKERVVFPLSIMLVLILGLSTFLFYLYQTTLWERQQQELNSQLQSHIEIEVNWGVELMSLALTLLEHDAAIISAFMARDREQLLSLTEGTFQELGRDSDISHFYFTDMERVNFLRVHQPDRYGDTIGRETTLAAQRSGNVAWGLEIGPLGTYNLRVVRPLLAQGHSGRAIGFMELGIDIQSLIGHLSGDMGVELLVLVDKTLVQREVWESRVARQGDAMQWDHFDSVVVSHVALKKMQEGSGGHEEGTLEGALHTFLEQLFDEGGVEHDLLHGDGLTYSAGWATLNTHNRQLTGYLVGLKDITGEVTLLYQDLVWMIGAVFSISVLYVLYLYLFLGKTERWVSARQMDSLEEVYRANQARDDFLATMSHELRTPLSTIIGNSELLAEEERSKERLKMIETIEAAGRSQLALVNDILDMSKIESGKFTIDEAPFDLSVLMQDIYHMFELRMRDAGLEFVVEEGREEPYLLLGDGARIGQVLVNLVGNAIKFTETGRITLSSWSEGEYLLFSVEDTGVGISPEALDNLFQRFEQADSSNSRLFGGSGLGLFISESLASLMGGEMDASSLVGQGSKFQLRLPYRRSDQPVKRKSSTKRSGSVLQEQCGGRVLVVEDTLELQLLEQRILEAMGVEVIVANNGREAVDLVAEQPSASPFDLILMDMQMPVMDGIEATQTLRTAGCQTPIVA
ncbi:MAG: response regulator, partial [Gammaproteobacteria bacterium]|nr:response regulator [Gammaproteobacteria bacterium]